MKHVRFRGVLSLPGVDLGVAGGSQAGAGKVGVAACTGRELQGVERGRLSEVLDGLEAISARECLNLSR